jgi:hypothetical protein
MPDLTRAAVLSWLWENEPHLTDADNGEADQTMEAALCRLGAALDAALLSDPAKLTNFLRSESGIKNLRAILGQLDQPRILRLLGWIRNEGLPEGEAILLALLTPDPTGTGQYLQAMLAEAARIALLNRLYAPERLAMLRAACRSTDIRNAA